MGNEHGEWIMRGIDFYSPGCIRSEEQLEEYVNEVGFLPLFANKIIGFSVEEHTSPEYWWTGNEDRDPWYWREMAARNGNVAYGKFFDKKAGYISKKWLPYFVNYRRDGYDFDSRWDDELESYRNKKIMDLFADGEEYFSYEIKELAGFSSGGEKNFEGTIADLQMKTYLTVKDFRQKTNKRGELYGWSIAVYSTPESLFGTEFVRSAYSEAGSVSFGRIVENVKKHFPETDEIIIRRFMK